MRVFIFLLIISGLLMAAQVSFSGSEIYKWVDKDGNVQFTDKKSKQAERIEVKVNSVKNTNRIQDTGSDMEPDKLASAKKVTIYSAVWCGVCVQAKKYFKKQGIPYKEYDVEKSAKGRSDFKRLRGRAVPIIFVEKRRMNGFDIGAFEKMYRG